jgi:acetyl esterase/lipase
MSIPRLHRYAILSVASLLSACSSLVFGVANVPTYFGSYRRAVDVTYGSLPRQRLDVYAPPAARGLPVVIFWYGGSWSTGSKGSYRFVGSALANRGMIAVLPDYRVHPQVKFPDFLHDAATAVAWVQAHAREFGGDPQRIVLMGHSAGAHIATFIAYNSEFLRADGGRPEWLRGVIGLSGPYALDPNSHLLHTIFAAPYTHKDWQPVAFAKRAAPPTLLVHGMNDRVVAVRHAERLRDVLLTAGVRVDTAFYPEAGHADTVGAFTWLRRAKYPVLDHSVEFINEVTTPSVQEPRTTQAPPIGAAISVGVK